MIACFDFETYSPAGFIWDADSNKWIGPPGSGAKEKGLPTVGAAVYTEHPEAEVLSLAYCLVYEPRTPVLWKPGDNPPVDLFNYLAQGGLIEAWNVAFENWVWKNICAPKYGWPELPTNQLRCAMAKSRAFALPGALDNACLILNTKIRKNSQGKRLLNKFSKPRNPTKNNPLTRIFPLPEDPDTPLLYQYNIQDILAEEECSQLTPDLPPFELEFWQCDLKINSRGVQVDIDNIKHCIAIIEQAYVKYNNELHEITRGEVHAASEVQKLTYWVKSQGAHCNNLDAGTIEELLKLPLMPHVRRVLQIREMLSSAAVKKLYAMLNTVTKKGRIHDLFVYHSARTGRAAGAGTQPQNLPNSGPQVTACGVCKKHFGYQIRPCPWCGADSTSSTREWNHEVVEDVLDIISTQSLDCLEYYFTNPIETISGCLRGMFIAKPRCDLICSDYSAIEAVVLAALAGEEWRLEVFRTHGKIYEMSASKITGVPFEEFEKQYNETGSHHPLRKKVGKVAELASGYQGWIGAWKAFGADEFFRETVKFSVEPGPLDNRLHQQLVEQFADEEIKKAILAWRKASPKIVEFWGGQPDRYRNKTYFGVEGMAISACLQPGIEFNCRGIKFIYENNILFITLLSGRRLVYHKPQLHLENNKYHLSYEGWNTNIKNGPFGWIRINTWGGRLVENIVQATARDILTHAIVNLEKNNYPVVLHVHDEIVSEIPENTGSIEQFESIMSTMPRWATGWPIKATGGWRGKRYRK